MIREFLKILFHNFRLSCSHLDMSIYQPVQLDVVVIFAKRINQHLCDFQPSDVKTELQQYISVL